MSREMSHDDAARQGIRHLFESARAKIRIHTGLYSDEDLAGDVLLVCDEAMALVEPNPRLDEARSLVEERCWRLMQVADRFAEYDLSVIATARAQAMAAVDVLQDAVFEQRKASAAAPHLGYRLKRRSR
jgi:hypothetical protein